MQKYASSVKVGDVLAADKFFDIAESTVTAVVRQDFMVLIVSDDPIYPSGFMMRPFDRLEVR